ncbi:MAG: hypothetical protein H6581_17285 [Bacteroidia bacterium]|nr:hypothetical protein [Bacteroidia bacterium]
MNLFFIALFISSLAGCKEEVSGPPAEYYPMNTVEAESFARDLENAFLQNSVGFLASKISVDHLLDQSFYDLPPSRRKEMKISDWSRKQFAYQFASAVFEPARGGYLEAIRYFKKENGATVVVFRASSNEATNYFEIQPGRDARGNVMVENIYTYSSGEWISQSLRTVVLANFMDSSGEWVPQEEGGKEKVEAMKTLTKLYKENAFRQFLTGYETLPEKLKFQKSIMILRVEAARNVGETEYYLALDDFERQFADDSSWFIMGVDALYNRGDFPKLRNLLNKLEARIGQPDGVVEEFRGYSFLAEGDFPNALRHADKVIELEPEKDWGYFLKFKTEVQSLSYAEAIKSLDLLTKKFAMQPEEMEMEAVFENFLKSPEYQSWLSERKS